VTLDGLLRAGATDSSIVDPERRPSSWGWNASADRTRGPPHGWRLRGRVLTLEDIFRSIRRRWRLAAGIFLLACIGVGVFVFTRERDKPPIRYRATVTVQIASPAPKAANPGHKTTSTTVSVAAGQGVAKLALSTPTRNAALRGAKLAPPSRTVVFGAQVAPDGSVITLGVTAPTRVLATTVATSWGKAFSTARRTSAHDRIIAEQKQLTHKSHLLHQELLTVDLKLAKLLPGIYGGVFRFDKSFGTSAAGKNSSGSNTGAGITPAVPDGASTYVFNLALERPQLLDQITAIGTQTAKLTLTDVTPDAFARVLSQSPARPATKVRSTTVPAAGGLLGGLALGLAAAVLVDRRDRRIRDPRTAATAFGAPVLSIVPSATYSDYAVLSDPLSNVAEAYRGLAATSIATDRLPKAIMVSTPHGDAHEEVAANYAAALSRFGLKVALIATTPDQAWYAERFDSPHDGAADHASSNHGASTFPELLVAAHAGTLDGRLSEQLASDDRAPNLVVVPPSSDAPAHLPVDGLPPLLQALGDSGIDVVVVSGPALLEDADATIVAWATRCVLWAIVDGEITSTEARAAAARLELAGVVPFGVVMVGNRSNGI
jgi:Mrp family chromosome partitioning ATPase